MTYGTSTMVQNTLLAFCSLLCSCSTAPASVEIRVPVPVPCLATMPDRPEGLLPDSMLATLPNAKLVLELRAQQLLERGYARQLEAALRACLQG